MTDIDRSNGPAMATYATRNVFAYTVTGRTTSVSSLGSHTTIIRRTLRKYEQERAVDEQVRICNRLSSDENRAPVSDVYAACQDANTHEGDVQDVNNAAGGRKTSLHRHNAKRGCNYQLRAPGKTIISLKSDVVTARAPSGLGEWECGSDDRERKGR